MRVDDEGRCEHLEPDFDIGLILDMLYLGGQIGELVKLGKQAYGINVLRPIIVIARDKQEKAGYSECFADIFTNEPLELVTANSVLSL